MSTFEKRAREDKKRDKAREKEQRRRDKKFTTSSGPEFTTAAEMNGNLRSIDEVMRTLQGGGPAVQRSAAPIPTKLFVGSLSDSTKNASLRAHFEKYGAVTEAAVILDRDTGMSRNFGFVTMTDRKDAPAAIAALHHSELDGSRIVVNVATERH